MKIAAIIPAYNCESSIDSVVRASLTYCNYVIVVDDASTDSTSDRAAKAGAIIKRLETNKGKSEALKQGINLAVLTGFEILVTIDADGEHDPSDIPILIEPIKLKLCSVVFGVREKTHGSCSIKNIRPTQSLLNKYFKVKLIDAMCGFRAYSYASIVELVRNAKVSGFGIDLEFAILTKLLNFRYLEIPISTVELKEYGGIRASHFDGLIENIEIFSKSIKINNKLKNYLASRIQNRDNFQILIGNQELIFKYDERDGFYYRR